MVLLVHVPDAAFEEARTQALNQLRAVLVTAPDDLRARLRDLPRGELLATCAAFRIRADDDSLAAITRLTLREMAARIAFLDAQLKATVARLRRITTALAPDGFRNRRLKQSRSAPLPDPEL